MNLIYELPDLIALTATLHSRRHGLTSCCRPGAVIKCGVFDKQENARSLQIYDTAQNVPRTYAHAGEKVQMIMNQPRSQRPLAGPLRARINKLTMPMRCNMKFV